MDLEKNSEPARTTTSLDSNDTHVEPSAKAVTNTQAGAASPIENAPPKPVAASPPPNGGFNAWLQVAGSFFLFFNSWGTVNGFGVFQTYYENNPYWKASPSDISWIGSMQAFLLLVVGVFTGPVYDLGYFKTLLASGAFLISFGFMMTSLSREYWQVFLAQGLVVGLGNGCLWVPSVAIIPQYFTTKKAFASGIAAAGSSIGGIIYPIVFRQLEKSVGFPWAVRVLGFIALGTLAFSLLVMKQRVVPRQTRKLHDLAAFKEPPYALFCVGMFLAFASFYGPIYYVGPFAIAKKLTNVNLAFYLLPILNAASVPGRIIPNFVADYIGPFNILIPATAAGSILILCWIAINSWGGVLTFSILYGFFSGAIVAIAPVGVVVLTKDMSKLGTRMGQNFFVCSFGVLIGTPVVGAIVSNDNYYLGMQLFCGIVLIAASATFVATKYFMVGFKPFAKA